MQSALVTENSWWVFQRPLMGDRLFVIGLVVGLLGILFGIPKLDDMGLMAAVLSVLLAIPYALLVVGVVGGSVRQYRRGRNGSA